MTFEQGAHALSEETRMQIEWEHAVGAESLPSSYTQRIIAARAPACVTLNSISSEDTGYGTLEGSFMLP